MSPVATPAAKKGLRAQLRQERDAFAATPEAKEVEAALNAHLAAFLANALPLLPEPAETFEIASFLPLGSEFDLNLGATPQWLYPRVAEEGSLVWFRRGPSIERLRVGAFGIREAERQECFECHASPRAPWVVLVPALACDTEHVRLGYGGGYYDRFLARHGDHLLTVCALPSRFVLPTLPREPHDRPVDVLIDEHSVSYVTR